MLQKIKWPTVCLWLSDLDVVICTKGPRNSGLPRNFCLVKMSKIFFISIIKIHCCSIKTFSRQIELYLYSTKLNQTSRKPKNSPQKAVKFSFQSQVLPTIFQGSTGGLFCSLHIFAFNLHQQWNRSHTVKLKKKHFKK